MNRRHVTIKLRVCIRLLFLCLPISACPVCHTAVGRQVRKAILSQDFLRNVAFTLAPFPAFMAVVASIYFWFPTNGVERRETGG